MWPLVNPHTHIRTHTNTHTHTHTRQVKHDDLREAAAQFITELTGGKEFIADSKMSQMETMASNVANVKEELASILTSLSKGG